MEVFALVGKSGTGKSYQAINLCRERDIESIIDDGLFIYGGNSFVGTSAKRVETKVGAIKTALFSDDAHRDMVAEAIKREDPANILVLGTSDGMVHKIVERLGLPPIKEIIRIEDITTEGERETAYKLRNQQGKHIVPIPSAQLKREFSGFFMSPQRLIRGIVFGRGMEEKTVIRPSYSYRGDYIISEKVIANIVEIIAEEMGAIADHIRVLSEKPSGQLQVNIYATFNSDGVLVDMLEKFQHRCAEKIEEMTAFNIESVNITVENIRAF